LLKEHILLDRFLIADANEIYLDGNSLGRLPLAAQRRLETLVRESWGTDLISGWNRDWIGLPRRIGDKIGALVGARDGECVVADSTSVNLFKLATAAVRLQSGRSKIITDATNFPSDLYILQSAASAAGGERVVEVVGRPDQTEVDTEALISRIDSQTALVSLSHVTFRSGSLYPMREINDAAHDVGALVLWDLSHSVGAVPIELNASGSDLAVGCTYKYLCGGPGAPAFLYVREDLQTSLTNPIAGWFSHQSPFTFDQAYSPSASIDRFLTGTPPVLSLAAIEAGIDLVQEVGMPKLRRRSVALTSRFIDHFDASMARLGFSLRTPRSADARGSHISLGHPEARRITQNLIERHKVIPDFRSPDNLRLGFAPLYTTEQEVDQAAAAIIRTVVEREFETVVIGDQPVT
jgi:kynureninase